MKQLGLLVFLFSVSVINAQTKTPAKEYEVDRKLSACLDSSENFSTAGQIQCTARAVDAWDKELNKYYKLLMSILSPDEKEKLKKAQQNWLLFRDNELAFEGTAYNNLEGSMWRVTAVMRELEIVKQRAVDLIEYYAVFKENKGGSK